MAKKYSTEHIALKYAVAKSRIEQWVKSKYGELLLEIPAADNAEIATYLGVLPKRLSGKKKLKPRNKNLNIIIDKEKKPIVDKKLFKESLDSLSKKEFRENALGFYRYLRDRVEHNKQWISDLETTYNSLPTKKTYEKTLDIKYFTWHDIEFHKNGYRINPNKVVFSKFVDGPTKILQNLDIKHFIDKRQSPLFKVYVHKYTGKVVEELSMDIEWITNKIKQYIESRDTTTNANKKPLRSITKVAPGETKHVDKNYIEDRFSSNPYIMWLSKTVLGKGHALATALWENNNDMPEESILFVTKSKNYTYAIWENIHVARACYVFQYEDSQKSTNNIIKLMEFIYGPRINKRESLFNRELNHGHVLGTVNYFTLKHTDLGSYRQRIYEVVPHLRE